MYNNLLCTPCDNSNLEVQPMKDSNIRNPKIYLISVYRKKNILKLGEPIEFVKFVDVDCALYQITCDTLEAKKFTLEEASYIVTAMSKMLPEFFMINLNSSYHVQKEYGKL
jgi:hypothetical protein